MSTRQIRIIQACAVAVALSCVCPPWHRGNYSIPFGLIFAPPAYATVDLSRLVLEWTAIAAVCAVLFLASPSSSRGSGAKVVAASPRWSVGHLKLLVSRRAAIGLMVLLATIVSAWGIWRVSWRLPADEINCMDGLCASSFGTFSGSIHNGSRFWTVRELTIRLTLKGTRGSELPSSTSSRDYRIRNLWIRPLETSKISVQVLQPEDSEFGGWNIVDAEGIRTSWRTIRSPNAASPGVGRPFRVPPEDFSSGIRSRIEEARQNGYTDAEIADFLLAPRNRNRDKPSAGTSSMLTFDCSEVDPVPSKSSVFDQILDGVPPAKTGQTGDAVRVRSSESRGAGRAIGQSADSKGIPANSFEGKKSQLTITGEEPLAMVEGRMSILEAGRAGYVRASYRNPTGQSSGDTILLTVIKMGGPKRLVMTLPTGLVPKSPSPTTQDMVISGLKGLGVGGGKYNASETITLTGNEPVKYIVDAYCADFYRDNPPTGPFDFRVAPAPDSGMACVLNGARREGLTVVGTQAAVWIYADHLPFSKIHAHGDSSG